MTGIMHFETFLLAGVLLNITPGNDTIFILSKSMAQGQRAGIVSALGIGTGCIVHTVLAAFGLSFVITQSIVLFNLIKYAGAMYLFYMGYKMLTSQTDFSGENNQPQERVNYRKIYRDGIFTNVLNPKVALFFISFLPQFIDPNLKNTVIPFLTLGTTFIATGTIWSLTLAIFAASIFQKLKTKPKIAAYVNKFCGMTMLGLGLKVALSERK